MENTSDKNKETFDRAAFDEKNRATVLHIMDVARQNYPKDDVSKIMDAYRTADLMHDGQFRESGEPYIVHPIAVASMLADMSAGVDCIVAGMLHDVAEDTSMTVDDVQEAFGPRVAHLVDGVTKLKTISETTKEEREVENLRKMYLAIADDPRVVIIKLADRLHNMRTLQYTDRDKQIRKAKETLEIYAPLAHRFGMSNVKWELEDLCFKYLEPEKYHDLKHQLNQKREEREAYIKKVIDIVKASLKKENIEAFVDGRPKHLYSIKRKMEAQHVGLEQIYDLLAIRVVVDTVPQCYMVMGIVHGLFNPIEGRIKDYIAKPKQNHYQSIHTTVVGPDGQKFEIQIRTWDMHNAAELGIAAHWHYKATGGSSAVGAEGEKENEYYEWVRNLTKTDKDVNSREFVEDFKRNLYVDEVFVYTPKGEVKKLPQGSNPIDFAYAVHTSVGNRMIGAKVNGEFKPLNYVLVNGDKVEIITSNDPNKAPSRDWINQVKSSEAKTKLRQWFKKERREENIELGKVMLDRELKRQKITLKQLFEDKEIVDTFLSRSNLHSVEDLLNSIGFGDLIAQKVIQRLKDAYTKKYDEKDKQNPLKILESLPGTEEKEPSNNGGIVVQNLSNCLYHLAKCCTPIFGDDIVGYTSRVKGVSVHRRDCPNLAAMIKNEPERLMEVSWNGIKKNNEAHPADIILEATDDNRVISSVANLVSEMGLKLLSINAKNTKDDTKAIEITVKLSDKQELEKLITKLRGLDFILSVARKVK